MTKRLLTILGASVAIAMVGAPLAGATPVKSQYDNPTTGIVDETPGGDTTPAVNTPVVVKSAKSSATATNKPVAAKAAPTAAATSVPAPAVQTSDSLPFTGLNAGLVLLFGGLALATGLALRSYAHRRHQ